MTSTPTKRKPKVVVFDVDETLGNFAQFGLFCATLDEYYKADISYKHFNDLVEIFPEIFRPNIIRILDYIRKKKDNGVCSKVMIYTNNQGPDKWIQHIRDYLEMKLRVKTLAASTASTASAELAIIPPLFDHIIGGFKPRNGMSSSAAAAATAAQRYPERTTGEKTVSEFLRCSRLPPDIDICFLDDILHERMVDEKVYYIKLQGYHSYIPFEHYVLRFLGSKLYKNTFELMKPVTGTIVSTMTPQVKKQVITIEIQNLLVKRANQAQYDARKHHNKMNPREIDEIISKYILHHLQQFFKDGPPALSANARKPSHRGTRTMKKNSMRQQQRSNVSNDSNIFYVDKSTSVKNMRNKTVRNK
jgi:hypothetical protein